MINGQHQCFWFIAAKHLASPVGCCVWMRPLAVSKICIRWARCKSGYRAPESRTHLSSDLVRNRITPLGGKHRRRLVVYTRNSSGIKCTHLSGRFGQIGYHYKLQDSAKMCPPVLKCHQLQDASPLTPTGSSAPWISAPRLPRSP